MILRLAIPPHVSVASFNATIARSDSGQLSRHFPARDQGSDEGRRAGGDVAVFRARLHDGALVSPSRSALLARTAPELAGPEESRVLPLKMCCKAGAAQVAFFETPSPRVRRPSAETGVGAKNSMAAAP